MTIDRNLSGGLRFMPAVRNASPTGKLAISWFQRAIPNTTLTDVAAAVAIDPRTTTTPRSQVLATDTPSDWSYAVSDIQPNFGDYLDNYAAGGRVYLAWSDGRTAVPQPFEASEPMP